MNDLIKIRDDILALGVDTIITSIEKSLGYGTKVDMSIEGRYNFCKDGTVYEYQDYGRAIKEGFRPDFGCHNGGWFIDFGDYDKQPDLIVCFGEISGFKEPIRLRDLDVQDVSNIQPHEYGLLKLKYGLTKDMLFIPAVFKPLCKAIHENCKGVMHEW